MIKRLSIFLFVMFSFLNVNHVSAQFVFSNNNTVSMPSSTENTFSIIGDSRAQQIWAGAGQYGALAGNHWFNAANALMNHSMILIGNYGISGARSDQFLQGKDTTNTLQTFCGIQGSTSCGLSSLLSDLAATDIFNMGCINDIAASVSGYTNTYGSDNGTAVTTSNVAKICTDNIIYAVKQALAVGKRVILVAEIGATNFSTSQVAAVFAVNEYLREFKEVTRGVLFWDPTSIMWNPASSSTAIVFNTNYAYDTTTHPGLLGGYHLAADAGGFVSFMTPILTSFEQRLNNAAMIPATSPIDILVNPLFTTATGGTTSGSGTITGNVPSGWTVQAPNSTSTVAVSSTADASGFGNDITLTITTTASDTINIFGGPGNNALWNLGDIMQSGIVASVASGSANAAVQFQCQYNTNLGTPNCFDMSATGAFNTVGGPTTAYSYVLQAPKMQVSGSTQGYIAVFGQIVVSGAGHMTVTFSRGKIRRRFSEIQVPENDPRQMNGAA